MKKQYVVQLRAGDKVASSFAVISKQLSSFSAKSSKAGQEYMKVILKDSSGIIEGVIWEDALVYFPLFEVDDIVFVEGIVSQYHGLQITIANIKPVPAEAVDISNFISPSPVNIFALKQELTGYIKSIRHPSIIELLQKVFSGKMMEDFCCCPGGRSIHHAYRGGLLKHTIEVASIAKNFSAIHENLNHDILISGALLHDIGKTREYDLKSVSFKLTDKGQLYGHLVLGRDLLMQLTSSIKGFPVELEDEIGHMMLSHHGHKEWGSPEVPKTLEAFALFHADLSSARMDQAVNILESTKPTARWSSWDKLLERSFYNPERKYFSPESEIASSLDEDDQAPKP